METNDFSVTEQIRRLLILKRVVDLETLQRSTSGRSHRSLFRDLAKLHYLSSYTHAGSFYTLPGIPQWDEHRLWFHQGVGFSEAGTLKDTIVELLNHAPAGYLHREIESLVRVRAHNPLLVLVREGHIVRESLGPRRSLYLSADTERAHAQRQARKTLLASEPVPAPLLEVGSRDAVIAILVETINSTAHLPTPDQVARRLAMRNHSVSSDLVATVWTYFGIDRQKKTVESRPEPSKK